jgi:hypothetical protein
MEVMPGQETTPYDPETDACLYYFTQGLPRVKIEVQDYSLSSDGLLTYQLAMKPETMEGEVSCAAFLECPFQVLEGRKGYRLLAVSLKRLEEI